MTESFRINFTSPHGQPPGTVYSLLMQSYQALVDAEPVPYENEINKWREFDFDVYNSPDTVGACTFLSWWDNNLIGLSSYDPRPRPEFGIIGHNCILPGFRGKGFGQQQIRHTLQLMKTRGIRTAKVSTNDHPFFVPAQKMYTACGFQEAKRVPWSDDHTQFMIHYQMKLNECR